MNFCTSIFNNREKAIFFWLLIFLAWALSKNNIRTSFLDLFKAFFHKKILIPVMLMLLYVALIISQFYKLNFWNGSLAKDTIFWVLGTAFVLLLNSNKANEDEMYFKKLLLDNLKFIAVLEFITSFHTFNLPVEMVLIPFIVLISAMSAVAETQKEHVLVKKILDVVLIIIGILITIFALYHVFTNYQSLFATDNIRAFLLPPLLTTTFLPFIYCFALLMAYETFFVRLDCFMKNDKKLARFIKRKTLAFCHVSLRKLNSFIKENNMEFINLSSKEDFLNLIEKYKKV